MIFISSFNYSRLLCSALVDLTKRICCFFLTSLKVIHIIPLNHSSKKVVFDKQFERLIYMPVFWLSSPHALQMNSVIFHELLLKLHDPPPQHLLPLSPATSAVLKTEYDLWPRLALTCLSKELEAWYALKEVFVHLLVWNGLNQSNRWVHIHITCAD